MVAGFRTANFLYEFGPSGTRRHSLTPGETGWTQRSHCLFVTPMPRQDFGLADERLVAVYLPADRNEPVPLKFLANGDAEERPAGCEYGGLHRQDRKTGATNHYFPAFLQPVYGLMPVEFSQSLYDKRIAMHHDGKITEIFRLPMEFDRAVLAAGISMPDAATARDFLRSQARPVGQGAYAAAGVS